MKRLLILICLLNVATLAFGQINFQRSYGGPGGDYGRAVIECSSGGYAIVGSTNSYQSLGTAIYLLRVDEVGDYMWGKHIGEPNKTAWGVEIAEDEEGNFIIAGYSDSSPSGTYDGLLLKTNPVGEVIWQKSYGGDDWDFIEGMVLNDSNEIVLAGFKTVDGHQRGWLFKTDHDGEVVWEKLIDSSGQLKITGVDFCENGSIVFAGYTTNMLLDTKTFVAGKFLDNGNLVWLSTYPEFGQVETGKCICGSENQLFSVLTQFNEDGTHNISVNSINTLSGAVNWRNVLQVDYAFGNGIMQKANGEIFFAGTMDGYGFDSYSGSINCYAESGGHIQFPHSAIVGGYGYDELYDIIATSDGGQIAVGQSSSFGNNYQVHVCKMDSLGTYSIVNTDFLDLATPISSRPEQLNFNIYPNPAISTLHLEFDFNKDTSYGIFSVTGKEVMIGRFENAVNNEIDISQLRSGMYILRLYENRIPIGTARFIKLP